MILVTATSGSTVVVIDAQPVVFSGIDRWIAEKFGGHSAVRAYQSVPQFLRRRPQNHRLSVVICDPQRGIERPDFAGLQELCSLETPVIVYSWAASAEIILTYLDAGAVTYIAKSDPPRELLDAMWAVQSGQECQGASASAARLHAHKYGRPQLTAQERRVLGAWLRTDSKEAAARDLHLSPSTVRTHLHRIRRRYEVAGRRAPSKAALFGRAVQDGLLSIDDL